MTYIRLPWIFLKKDTQLIHINTEGARSEKAPEKGDASHQKPTVPIHITHSNVFTQHACLKSWKDSHSPHIFPYCIPQPLTTFRKANLRNAQGRNMTAHGCGRPSPAENWQHRLSALTQGCHSQQQYHRQKRTASA